MDRIVQSHRFGPHRVNVVELVDDEGGGYVVVVIDGAVITEPPLASVPRIDELMSIYAAWKSSHGG